MTFTPVTAGPAIDARLWYTSAGQVAALLPSSATAGDYDVRVIYNGQASAPARAKVVERNFGYATVAQNGAGPAQATNASLNNGVSLVRFTTGTISFNNLDWQHRPAYPGETLVLWGTGVGADAQSDVSGGTSGDQTAAGNIRVIVGGTEIMPGYAGRSGGSPGLDQINFTLPANVPLGCTVSLQVRASGRLSNMGSLAISNSGQTQCAHPALTESQLKKLDKGGTITVGALHLSKLSIKLAVPGLGSVDSTTETAGGAFSRFSISQIGDASFSLTQSGACSVFRRTGDLSTVTAGMVPQALNAGAQLTLNGPNVPSLAIPNQQNTYLATLYSSGFGGVGGTGSPTLAPGTYTITGPGGPDIGAFSASVNFPAAFTWTNESTIPAVIPRSQNLQITWTGGGEGLVAISGFAGSQVSGTQTNPVYDVAGFFCAPQASAGSFAVPPSILQQLPFVSGDLTSAIGNLAVMAVPDPSKGQGIFTAPLTTGGNADLSYFGYMVGSSKSVGFN